MAFALTFDDGPGPSTQELLAVLRAHRCSATFFLLGENIKEERASIVQLLREGHLAGNHTMTHNARLPLADLRREIETCDALLQVLYEEAGVATPRPIPFRLPFGIRTFISERVENNVRKPAVALDNRLQLLASMGRSHAHWTAILPDWEARSEADAERLADTAIEHIGHMETEGLDAVLAMHDGSQPNSDGVIETREWTVKAVEAILSRANKKGWTTFRVPVV